MNSDAINGVSGPGGFVLLTRGAIEACRTEDEVAALLAHELAHVSRKHGVTILRQGKTWQTGIQGLIQTTSSAAGFDQNRFASQLVQFFSQAVSEMARTSTEHDYGQAYEFEADLEGTYLLMDVVYDHAALRDFLRMLASRSGGAFGKAATHAPPAVRAAQLDPVIQRAGPFQGNAEVKQVRVDRLKAALGRGAAAPR